jgi:hypothetical protein
MQLVVCFVLVVFLKSVLTSVFCLKLVYSAMVIAMRHDFIV